MDPGAGLLFRIFATAQLIVMAGDRRQLLEAAWIGD